MRILPIIILLGVAACCPTKKLTDTQTTVLKDSIFKRVELTHSPEIHSDFTLHHICDTVRGPVEFEKVFVIKKDTIRVSVKDNSLAVAINKIQDTLSTKEIQIEQMDKEITRLRNELKTKKVIPLWVWLIGGYLILLLIRKLDGLIPFLPPPIRSGLRLIT